MMADVVMRVVVAVAARVVVAVAGDSGCGYQIPPVRVWCPPAPPPGFPSSYFARLPPRQTCAGSWPRPQPGPSAAAIASYCPSASRARERGTGYACVHTQASKCCFLHCSSPPMSFVCQDPIPQQRPARYILHASTASCHNPPPHITYTNIYTELPVGSLQMYHFRELYESGSRAVEYALCALGDDLRSRLKNGPQYADQRLRTQTFWQRRIARLLRMSGTVAAKRP